MTADIDLHAFEKELETLGFDTAVSGQVLSASIGNDVSALELNIDETGTCLVKKKILLETADQKYRILAQDTPLVREKHRLWQFRVNLTSPADLASLLKSLERLG